MSAPSAARRRACSIAAFDSRNWPPSENESEVTFSTPMTSGRALAKSCASTPSPGAALGAEIARWLVLVAAVLAILQVPWALPAAAGAANFWGTWAQICRGSIADDRRQFLGLVDPAHDRLHRRQN